MCLSEERRDERKECMLKMDKIDNKYTNKTFDEMKRVDGMEMNIGKLENFQKF